MPNYYKLHDYLGVLSISGADCQKFLQGQLTIDVNELAQGDAKLAAHCSPKGRVISIFHVLKTSDGYQLVLPRQSVHLTLTALKKYALFYKTTLSFEHSASILGLSESNSGYYYSTTRRVLINDPSLQPKVSLSGEDWKLLNFQEKIPYIVPETSEMFLPHELHLQHLGALSWSKGCYTGQEIIARTHYLGKTKKTLKRICFEGIVSDVHPGEQVAIKLADDFKRVGTVVDIGHDQTQSYALIVLDADKYTTYSFYVNTNPCKVCD